MTPKKTCHDKSNHVVMSCDVMFISRHVMSRPPSHVESRGAPDPYPDPAASNASGSGSDRDPAGSEVGSGKHWPDLHNYDIKRHSILSFQEMTHDSTELYTKTQ